jgi:hypothetical protein
MSEADPLELRCQSAGLRLTASRRALLATLRELAMPCDAVALLRAAQQRHADVRLGSVYRFLRELEQLDLAHAETQPHGRLRWHVHDHLPACAGVPPSDDAALLAQMRTFLRELESLGFAVQAPPADMPAGAPHSTIRLLQQVAARFGYRLASRLPPTY